MSLGPRRQDPIAVHEVPLRHHDRLIAAGQRLGGVGSVSGFPSMDVLRGSIQPRRTGAPAVSSAFTRRRRESGCARARAAGWPAREGQQTGASAAAARYAERAAWAARMDFDVIILGGGVNGTGTARDCAMRGLRVLLLEKADYGVGASGNSSGMIHGGIRYMLSDRHVTALACRDLHIQRIAPHLLFRIPFLLPFTTRKEGATLRDRAAWYATEVYVGTYDLFQLLEAREALDVLHRRRALPARAGPSPRAPRGGDARRVGHRRNLALALERALGAGARRRAPDLDRGALYTEGGACEASAIVTCSLARRGGARAGRVQRDRGVVARARAAERRGGPDASGERRPPSRSTGATPTTASSSRRWTGGGCS